MTDTKTIAPTGTEAGIDLDKLEALMSAAKVGRWTAVKHNWSNVGIYSAGRPVACLSIIDDATEENQDALEAEMDADAEIMVAACNALPALIALARRVAPATSPHAVDADKRALRSMFERAAEAFLGSPMVAYAPGFQKDDDGDYQYANTRRLFAFWNAARASLAPVSAQQPDTDDEWDRNAELLTREMGIGGGKINPDAISIDDLFIDEDEPVSAQQGAAVEKQLESDVEQVRCALELCEAEDAGAFERVLAILTLNGLVRDDRAAAKAPAAQAVIAPTDEQIVQIYNRVQGRWSSFGGPLNAVLKFAREILAAPVAAVQQDDVRDQVLEEAASACEAQEGLDKGDWAIAKGCAMAIRALKSPSTGQTGDQQGGAE